MRLLGQEIFVNFLSFFRQRASTIMNIYPEGHQAAAVIPLLDLAQRQLGKGDVKPRNVQCGKGNVVWFVPRDVMQTFLKILNFYAMRKLFICM